MSAMGPWKAPSEPAPRSLREPAEFVAFYERRIEEVLSFFMARTFDPHATADLTAETFATAFERRATFDPGRGTDGAWVLGIAKNQLRRMYRRGRIDERARRRLGMPRIELDPTSIERIEELVDLDRRKQALQAALGGLSSKTADAVRLRIMEDRPYEDVARALGCSPGAARVRVARGLARLAKTLPDLKQAEK